MPKNPDIKSILVIGSGPIVIGQACEFDYSGTQALKALREEGYRTILVNSNPATIMTDTEMADATYIEPITPEYVTHIIEKERPCALIATLGGQTSLNCALALHKAGVLAKYNVALIGASVEAITLAEDRALFRQKMLEIGLDVPQSRVARNLEEVAKAVEELGLPLIVRASFALGGAGAGIAYTKEEAMQICQASFASPAFPEVTLDEALIGWKEFELEVVRDRRDNCIVVCGVENFDPLGIHTGDSITVAPVQTLTDKEYQKMRDAAFAVLRAIGVDTGGSNVQFAVNPQNGRMVVIEMNPRVSRSSALVSKATGFPIAKIAAKLAVGYTLDELRNEITDGVLPASFEPSIDYVVVKIPRFNDEKFNAQDLSRGPQMRSIGEVMAIGSTFAESLQNAICSLEMGSSGFDLFHEVDDASLQVMLRNHASTHLWAIAEGLRRGFSVEEVHAASFVDPWFLQQIKKIVETEKSLQGKKLEGMSRAEVLHLKKQGFSDQRLAKLLNATEASVRSRRQSLDVVPVYKCVDSCAGEFGTSTAYMYSTYQEHCESRPTALKKIMIIGSGPNRIGQGIEFDYVCVKAIQAFAKAGYETIMVNCNPETVSTDYDVADKLYFVPITGEKVMDIIEKERPTAVALQFGGQTPLNLMEKLDKAGVPLIGLDAETVSLTEDRDNFRSLVQSLGLKQPKNLIVTRWEEAKIIAGILSFPLILRPSFILGGRGMEVVLDQETLIEKLKDIFKTTDHPVLVEEFLQGAIELDVDAVSDGEEVFIPAVLEHIEAVGVHSGDSACITPQYKMSKAMLNVIYRQTRDIAQALKLRGLMNIQFAVKGTDIYLIEVNPRASRTTPFICKATGIPLVDIAVNCMLGRSLKEQNCIAPVTLPCFFVKEAVLPFRKFSTSDPALSPEMKATGEVMGIGRTPYEAFFKAQAASGHPLSMAKGAVLISGLPADAPLCRDLSRLGCEIQHVLDVKRPPQLLVSLDGRHVSFALQNNIAYASTYEAAEMMVKTMMEKKMEGGLFVAPLQELYAQIRHSSRTRHLLTGMELTPEDMGCMLKTAQVLKKDPEKYRTLLSGKSLAMVFDKPSFRTRLSFALAIQTLGGVCVESASNARKSEEPRDLIRVLNGYCDFVMIRTHDDAGIRQMAEYSTIPIINGLSSLHHPCQILADLQTLHEYFGSLEGLTLAYVGDGNNILHSLMLMAPKLGVKIRYCCPPDNQPKREIVQQCAGDMVESCPTVQDAVRNVHAVYTDVWTSMGFEGQTDEKNFAGFQVNEALMAQARPEAVFMHCMPMERGKEVSSTLPDSPSSVIFAQSENRLHVQKAVLLFLQGIDV